MLKRRLPISKFALGFIVAIGMVIGCGAVNSAPTAATKTAKKGLPARLVVVSKVLRYEIGGYDTQFTKMFIVKDTKTKKEFLVVKTEESISVTPIIEKLRAVI